MRKFAINSPADPTAMREEVVLTVDGQDHLLCFDMQASAAVQLETGINLLAAAIREPDAVTLPAMLLASLRKTEPEMKLETVQGWVSMKNVLILHSAVMAAWFESAADDEGEDPTGKTEGQARRKRRKRVN